VVVSLCGGHLLGDRLCVPLVSHLPEALVFELGEPDSVGGVADVEVKHGPNEGEAAGFAGEPADHLGASFDLAKRPLEQVCASPPPAVSGRVAQVHDERLKVVGQALRRGGVAALVELVGESLEPLSAVALVDGLIERPPVGLANTLALPFGQLRQEVADAVNGAVLAV
jgi:hypothetical protein